MIYNTDQERKIKYLLRRMGEMKNGHTLSSQFTEGYPFAGYIDRFGKKTLNENEVTNNFLYKFFRENPELSKKIDLVEIAWQMYLVYGTPNGDLFKYNSMFKSIKEGKGLTLLHSTHCLSEIESSGLIYPSGGCLGASLYSVPLRSDGRAHNLTQFIMEYELPESLKRRGKNHSEDLLAIHLENENFIHSNEESNGMDYLLMGRLLSNVYSEFRFHCRDHLNTDVLEEFENQIVLQVKNTQKFLELCVGYEIGNISDGHFIDLFENALQTMPFLGYIYFEVLVEYVSLFQNDDVSLEHKELGELYNWHYKKMIFELKPELLDGFKLVLFNPSVLEVIYYLKIKSKNKNIFTHFMEDQFLDFFKWRVAQYVRYKLMDCKSLPANYDFDALITSNPSSVGHIVHREIRRNPAVKAESMVYEKKRAKSIWKEWNKGNVVYPYNSIVPKGEVGVNPGFNHLDYSVFHAKIDSKTNQVQIGRKLNIKLAFELITPQMSFMRSPN